MAGTPQRTSLLSCLLCLAPAPAIFAVAERRRTRRIATEAIAVWVVAGRHRNRSSNGQPAGNISILRATAPKTRYVHRSTQALPSIGAERADGDAALRGQDMRALAVSGQRAPVPLSAIRPASRSAACGWHPNRRRWCCCRLGRWYGWSPLGWRAMQPLGVVARTGRLQQSTGITKSRFESSLSRSSRSAAGGARRRIHNAGQLQVCVRQPLPQS